MSLDKRNSHLLQQMQKKNWASKTQELIISVAELQRRFNSQFRQVGYAKMGALTGKENGTVSHGRKKNGTEDITG